MKVVFSSLGGTEVANGTVQVQAQSISDMRFRYARMGFDDVILKDCTFEDSTFEEFIMAGIQRCTFIRCFFDGAVCDSTIFIDCTFIACTFSVPEGFSIGFEDNVIEEAPTFFDTCEFKYCSTLNSIQEHMRRCTVSE